MFGAFEAFRPFQVASAIHGGVVQFCPVGTAPRGVSPIQHRLQDPTGWPTFPVLPSCPAHRVLVVGSNGWLEPVAPRPGADIGPTDVAHLFGEEQSSLVIVGSLLQDVMHHGEPCRNVVSAAPALPVGTNDPVLFSVFIDARQAGKPISAVRTALHGGATVTQSPRLRLLW